MSYIVGTSTLSTLWSSLEKPAGVQRRASADKLLRQIGEFGWAQKADIEDVLYDLDPRLGSLDVEALAMSFGLPWRKVFPRPKAVEKEVFGFQHLAAADAAEFFLTLEGLGFAVDASALVEVIRPAIMRKANLTDSELAVYWFAKQRYRMAVTLRAENDSSGARSSKKIKTPEGYKAEIYLDSDDSPRWMYVSGPRHRHQKSRIVAAMLGSH